MLFYIDRSVTDYINNEEVQEALFKLAHARKDGIHLVYSESDTFRKIYKCNELDPKTRKIYNKIASKSRKRYWHLKQFKRRIVLMGGADKIEVNEVEDFREIKIPIEMLVNHKLVNEPILILEDISDFKVYTYIAKYVIKNKKYGKLDLKFNCIPGSGGGIKEVFKRKIEESYFVFSIADTDKKCPNGHKGSTIVPLINEYNRIKDSCLGEVFFDEYSEVENLVPTYYYDMIYSSEKSINEVAQEEASVTLDDENKFNKIIKWDELKKYIIKNNRFDIIRYFDYKEGIKVKILKDTNCKDYWSEILSELNSEFDINSYTCIDDSNKNNILIEGFNSKILKKVYDKMENSSDIESIIDKELLELWENIGTCLLEWGCSGEVIR